MRTLLVSLSLLATALAAAPAATAAPCYPDMPCGCEFGEVAVGWRCVGPCTLLDCEIPAGAGVTKCFDQLDRPVNDGGVTYCVDSDGPCYVSSSTEYIWGREYRCVVGA